ncbi:zinc finger, CCHC-type containing protein [Tanacetum coccineum]
MKILSVLLKITPDLATRAIGTPLSSSKGTIGCLCNPTPSGWHKTDALSTDLDQAINWLECLPAGSISTWEDLTTRFLAQFFPPGRTAKLRNDILMFQQHQGWNDPVFLEEESLDYKNPNIEELLGVIECKVDMLMKNTISLMGRSEDVCGMTSDMMRQLPPKPSSQEAFEDLVMNFILDQEKKVKQLKEYMNVIGSDFMQLSLEVIVKLKEEIRVEENRVKKIKEIMRYPNTEDLEPLNGHKFSEALIEKASFHTPKFISPKSLSLKYIRTIFPSSPLVRESTFSFKPDTNNDRNIKSRYDVENPNPQGIPIEVESLDETPLEDLGLNTCNHDIPLSSREIPSFDKPEP